MIKKIKNKSIQKSMWQWFEQNLGSSLVSPRIYHGPNASENYLENLSLRFLMSVCPILFTF